MSVYATSNRDAGNANAEIGGEVRVFVSSQFSKWTVALNAPVVYEVNNVPLKCCFYCVERFTVGV